MIFPFPFILPPENHNVNRKIKDNAFEQAVQTVEQHNFPLPKPIDLTVCSKLGIQRTIEVVVQRFPLWSTTSNLSHSIFFIALEGSKTSPIDS